MAFPPVAVENNLTFNQINIPQSVKASLQMTEEQVMQAENLTLQQYFEKMTKNQGIPASAIVKNQ